MKFPDSLEPTLADFKAGTLAWLIQRYIEEMPLVKPLGVSHVYALRRLQTYPIAMKRAAALKKQDFIEFCKDRRRNVVPATVNQDITFISSVLKFAASAWEDYPGSEDVSAAAIEAARPVLVKYQLIGKSVPRTRVPTDDEIDRLLAYFTARSKRCRVRVHMVPVILFALASTRRISEICRMTHGDIDWDRKDAQGNPTPMYMVRDMKHPKHKKGNDKWFALLDPMPEIIRMQPRRTANPDERVFPYYHKSAGSAYTRAKRELGIEGLHFHDNRREAITRWLAKFKSPHKVRFISGHDNTLILEKVYDATDPASLHGEYASLQFAAQFTNIYQPLIYSDGKPFVGDPNANTMIENLSEFLG